eukprot:223134-Chlamydomonas_euryale.AAC.3
MGVVWHVVRRLGALRTIGKPQPCSVLGALPVPGTIMMQPLATLPPKQKRRLPTASEERSTPRSRRRLPSSASVSSRRARHLPGCSRRHQGRSFPTSERATTFRNAGTCFLPSLVAPLQYKSVAMRAHFPTAPRRQQRSASKAAATSPGAASPSPPLHFGHRASGPHLDVRVSGRTAVAAAVEGAGARVSPAAATTFDVSPRRLQVRRACRRAWVCLYLARRRSPSRRARVLAAFSVALLVLGWACSAQLSTEAILSVGGGADAPNRRPDPPGAGRFLRGWGSRRGAPEGGRQAAAGERRAGGASAPAAQGGAAARGAGSEQRAASSMHWPARM